MNTLLNRPVIGMGLLVVLSACAPQAITSQREAQINSPFVSNVNERQDLPGVIGAPLARLPTVTSGGTNAGNRPTTPAPSTAPTSSSVKDALFPPKVGQVWRLTIDDVGVWRLRFLEVDSLGTATGNASTAVKVTRTSASTLQNGVRRFIVAENPLTYVCDFAPNAMRVEGGDTMMGGRAFESRAGQLVALEKSYNARLTPDD
jgi:hypothetical protein